MFRVLFAIGCSTTLKQVVSILCAENKFRKNANFFSNFGTLLRVYSIEGQKSPLSPYVPWQPNIRITGYIQLTLPQPKERRQVRPGSDAMRLPNRSGAPPEAGEVAWNTYLKRRVSNHDTHRGDALKASAVLPTMWYRKWELFPAAGSVVRPYIREVVSNRTEQKNFKKYNEGRSISGYSNMLPTKTGAALCFYF